MKKILVIANYDDFYNTRAEVIQKFLKKYKVYICYPYGPNADKFKKMGAKFININIDRRGTNPFHDLKLYNEYKAMIKEIKPDVVLTYSIKPNVYAGMVCKKFNIPYIANITGLGTALENPGILQKFAVMLHKIAFKRINCVFLQNEENLKFFKDRKIAHGKYRLIPGSGVNLDKFSVLEYPKNDTIEFLFIARVMKEKGIDQYLKAAEVIRKRHPTTVFHILGFCEEAYEDKLKHFQDKGIIHYHGMQKDVRSFIKRSHCTIHPSYYPEGMSNVCLESQASGRPVITTNRSGCRETVEDGVTGYIFPIMDDELLIEKIEQFINLTHEQKKQMGLNARKKVEKEFDRKIVIDAYIREIEKC